MLTAGNPSNFNSLIALDLAVLGERPQPRATKPSYAPYGVDVLEPQIPEESRTARDLLRSAMREGQCVHDAFGNTYTSRADLRMGSHASVHLAVRKELRKRPQIVALKTTDLSELGAFGLREDAFLPFALREYDVMLRAKSPLSPVALLAVAAAHSPYLVRLSLKPTHLVAVMPLLACDAEALNHTLAGAAFHRRRAVARYALARGLEMLEPLHKNDKVHGDLRKRNLFFDFRGELHVGDFGLASDTHDHSISGGALTYWPPSAVARALRVRHPSPAPRSPRDDLWSFGLCVLNLLAGEHPLQYGINAPTDRLLAAKLRQSLKLRLESAVATHDVHARHVNNVIQRAEETAPEVMHLLRHMLTYNVAGEPYDASAMRAHATRAGLSSEGVERNQVARHFLELPPFPTWQQAAKLRRHLERRPQTTTVSAA